MGEVYRAEDTRLSREVAIKVLPEQFTQDPQRLARFEREAKLLASLNHPNIAAIHSFEHSDDIHFLVLELVPGETLAERVAKGPLPVEEALEVCRQIAEGVEAAHEKGVIHRDLKPANVKVTPEGKVKILDFGLAKAFEGEVPVTDISQSPTLTEEMTRAGVIMGTAAYMSPEQARGKTVDKRADIFAFGAVLYELLTGKRAFQGETITETLGAIIHKEPDWATLPESTPSIIQVLLRQCLQKDPDSRLRDIADFQALSEATLAPVEPISAAQPPLWKKGIPWGIAAIALVIAGITVWNLRMSSIPQPLTHMVLTLPSGEALGTPGHQVVALSPDSAHLVYVANQQLYLRAMDQPESRPIPGTEGGEGPFFSPDGQWLGFFTIDGLKKVSINGGAPLSLSDVTHIHGASWDTDDNIIFAPNSGDRGLFRISAAGGEPVALTTPDPNKGEIRHSWPQILPGDEAVLFTVLSGGNWDNSQIVVEQIEERERSVLIEGGTHARYVPTGHLVFARGNTLMAVPFDLARLEVTSGPVPIVEGVMYVSGTGTAQFSFSDLGSLVYVEGEGGTAPGKPVWVDRNGDVVESIVEDALEFPRYPRISPDGRRLAITTGQGNAGGLWIYDLGGQPPYPLSLEGMNGQPVWTPDGSKVAFSFGTPIGDLFWIPADGSTLEPEPLLEDSTRHQFPESWTPDGQELIFVQLDANGANDIMAVSQNGGEPRLVVQTQHSASTPGERGGVASLSPDSRWLAYVSAVTGEPEIWIRPYPGPGAPVRISPSGGLEPVWSRDGHELYYLEGSKMMAVKIEAQPELRPQSPELLFDGNYFHQNRPSYDVATDGRFLMIQPMITEQETRIHVVLNWFEELKRLVPTDN